jgi:alanine dehydrogenase
MPNATSLIARTAAHALTSSAFPYLKMITELGFEKALKQNKALANGLYAEKGVVKKEFLQ